MTFDELMFAYARAYDPAYDVLQAQMMELTQSKTKQFPPEVMETTMVKGVYVVRSDEASDET